MNTKQRKRREKRKGRGGKVHQCSETFQLPRHAHIKKKILADISDGHKERERDKIVTSIRSLSDRNDDWRGHSGLVFGGG